jgi:putative Mn2+ efflux pump MntP
MERHPLDPISLTAGLIFTLAAVVGLSGAITLGIADLRWIGPALLVLFGVVLVATSVSKRQDEAHEPAVVNGPASDDRSDRDLETR